MQQNGGGRETQRCEARIILIPKEGKDLTKLQSYRPISQLNVGYKILTFILASGLMQVLISIIGPDQLVFLKKMPII